MGFARTTPSDYPCQLLRSGRLLSVGRSPTSNRKRNGKPPLRSNQIQRERDSLRRNGASLGEMGPQRRNMPILTGMQWGCIDVGACPKSDSAYGCRQMIGNVWEWDQYPPSAPIPALRLTLTRNILNRGLKPTTYYVAAAGQPVRVSSVIHGATSILQIGGMS